MPASPRNSPANVLFLFTDQQRRDGLSFYPGGLAHTPVLDALAAQGTCFDNAYTPCPICAPARASVQTGLYTSRHGVTNNIYQPGCSVHELPDSPSLLGHRLARAGVATGYSGKWHLGWGRDSWNDPYLMSHLREIDRHLLQFSYPEEYKQANSLPSSRGYSRADDFPGHGGGGHAYPAYLEYLKENGLSHDVVWHDEDHGVVTSPEESTVDAFLVERSLRIVEELAAQGKPWFHTLAFWGPHEPCLVPERYYNRYRDRSFAPWPGFDAGVTGAHRFKHRRSPWAAFENELRYYYAYCEFVDAQIGRLLACLAARGHLENTVVIFSSDHGDGRGCHGGLVDKGLFLYEEVSAIPLVILDPNAPASRRGARSPALCSLVDVYATVLDYAGVDLSEETETHSRSLRPLVRGETDTHRDQVLVQTNGLGAVAHGSRLLRHGKWAYLAHVGMEEELYDLEADPRQLCSRAKDGDCQGILHDLRARLLEELSLTSDLLGGEIRACFGRGG